MLDEDIKAEIESHGLSIEDLAGDLGITAHAIYKWHKIPRYAQAYLVQRKLLMEARKRVKEVEKREESLRDVVMDIMRDVAGKSDIEVLINERTSTHETD